MFGFMKKVLFTEITFFSFNPLSVNYLDCVSMNNQECKIRTKVVDMKNNEPAFYPFFIKVNKCSSTCK